MFKYLMVCGALLTLSTAPVVAQQQEAVLQRVHVSGADFDMVLAMPKNPPTMMGDLNMSPDALILHLTGGELTVAFDDEREILKVAESLRLSISSTHWSINDGKRRIPLAVYVVPKAE